MMIHETASTQLDATETVRRAEIAAGVAPGTWRLSGDGWLFLFAIDGVERGKFIVGRSSYEHALAGAECHVAQYIGGVRTVLLGAVQFHNGSILSHTTGARS